MSVDWNAFTPWSALAGGVLIGIAAAMFVLLNGRIAGISGVIGGLSSPRPATSPGGAAFVVGLLGAPLAYSLSHPAEAADSGAVWCPRAGRPAGGHRNALRFGLHQRPRRLRAVSSFASLACGHRRVHGRRLRHCVRDAPSVGHLTRTSC